jgi:hypothetical protein
MRHYRALISVPIDAAAADRAEETAGDLASPGNRRIPDRQTQTDGHRPGPQQSTGRASPCPGASEGPGATQERRVPTGTGPDRYPWLLGHRGLVHEQPTCYPGSPRPSWAVATLRTTGPRVAMMQGEPE